MKYRRWKNEGWGGSNEDLVPGAPVPGTIVPGTINVYIASLAIQ